MAKSLRSKWRRKCRAVKRVRYGLKELERLKKTVGVDDSKKDDAIMTELSAVATVVDKTDMLAKKKPAVDGTDGQTKEGDEENCSPMETNKTRVFNAKTMRDQNGAHPVWLHPRKVHRNAKAKSKVKAKRLKNNKNKIKKKR